MDFMLVKFYGLSIFAAIVWAILLADIGITVRLKGQIFEVFCISQAAIFGAVAGLVLMVNIADWQLFSSLMPYEDSFATISTVGIALVVSLSMGRVRETLSSTYRLDSSYVYLAIFVALLAFTQVFVAMVPSLEMHFTQKFLGDLATMPRSQAISSIIGASVLGGILIVCKSFNALAIQNALGFTTGISTSRRSQNFWLQAVIVGAVVYAVFVFGFLFTVAMILLPSLWSHFLGVRGLFYIRLSTAILAGATAGLGFIYSLQLPTMPTVPFIVAFLVISCLGILLAIWCYKRMKLKQL